AEMLARDRTRRPGDAAEVARRLPAASSLVPGGESPVLAHAARAGRPTLRGERQPMAIAVAWPGEARPDRAAAPASGAAGQLLRQAEAIAERWGGRVSVLRGGAVLLAFTGGAALREQATRAARAALDLAAALPDWQVSLGTVRSEVSSVASVAGDD